MGVTAAQNQFWSAAHTTQVYSHEWNVWEIFKILVSTLRGPSTLQGPPDWESRHQWAYSLGVGEVWWMPVSPVSPPSTTSVKSSDATASVASPTTKPLDYKCDLCDFKSKSKHGVSIHMGCAHQINNDLESSQNEKNLSDWRKCWNSRRLFINSISRWV